MKKYFSLVAFVAMVLVMVSCSSSPCDKLIKHMDTLQSEVMACTTQEQYDAVYVKVTSVDEMVNEESAKVKFTAEEGDKIKEKTAELTLKALIVKDILFAMPKDIVPTQEDMQAMVEKAMPENKTLVGYMAQMAVYASDVLGKKQIREIVNNHFNK